MEKEKTKSVFRHYVNALGNKYLFLFVFEAMMFGVGAYLNIVTVPLFIKGIIDSLSQGEPLGTILHFLTLFVSVSLLYTFFDRLYEFIDVRVMSRAMVKVADYGMDNLTLHSYQFFTNNFAGSLVTKLKRFVTSLDSLIGFIIREFILAVVGIVGIIFILFKTSIILGAVAFGWFSIFFITLVFFTWRRIPLERKKSEMESKVTGVISDIITNILNLKLFSSRKIERSYFDAVLETDHIVRSEAWNYANKGYTWQSVIAILAKSSLVFMSIVLWSQGKVTPGTIVLVITYGTTLFNRLGGLGSAIRKFSDSYVNAHEFTELLNQEMEIKDPNAPEGLRMTQGQISLNNVSFAYKQGRDIFSNFNFTIKSGEKVGIVGTSGAGKSTITKLLLRFADVTGGSITIDGQDIRNVTQDDLRSVISYVPQDPILFHRSLKENIAYGKPLATEEEIIEASEKAHAHEFIKGLRHGYDTLVGERGVKLSGGERQRVALARAILKNSKVLVLDEATSALDSVSEEYIQQALGELMQNKTVIVIAHRLSTIQKLDRIVVMEEGRIIEEGSHKELLKRKGTYANFWNRQAGGFIE